MNAKAWIPLVIAVVLGLVAAMMARNMLATKPAHSSAGGSPVKTLVVAKARILPGQEIKADNLTLAAIASNAKPENTFVEPTQLTGRISAATILPGQAILESLLAPKGANRGLQALVPDGMRAMTIEVDEFSGVGGLLIPGCRVDLISTFQGGGEHNEVVSRTIAQNVAVTAVGRTLATGGDPAPEIAKSVTLLVSPNQAEAIGLAITVGGRPRLVLRNSNDGNPADSAGISLSELRGQDPHAPAAVAQVVTPVVQSQLPTTRPANVVNRRVVQVIRNGVESTVLMDAPRNSRGPVADIAPINQ